MVLDKTKHRQVRADWQRQQGMSPAEFSRAVSALGLGQAGLGRFLGVSERTARRYVTGETSVPLATAMLLRLCIELKIPIRSPPWSPDQC